MGQLFLTPSFGVDQTNLPAAPDPTMVGVAATASATPHTKGSWVTAIASTDFDVYGITVVFSLTSASATVVNVLCDIGIGAAASEVVKVPNILAGGRGASTQAMLSQFLPIFIPKGTRIATRTQSNVASQVCNVGIWCHGGATMVPWPTFEAADSIGTNTATSAGVDLTTSSVGDTAFVDIGSTTGKLYKALLPMIQLGTTETTSALQTTIVKPGIGSVQIGEYFLNTTSAELIQSFFPVMPLYIRIATGTQLQVRTRSTGADIYNHAYLGFY